MQREKKDQVKDKDQGQGQDEEKNDGNYNKAESSAVHPAQLVLAAVARLERKVFVRTLSVGARAARGHLGSHAAAEPATDRTGGQHLRGVRGTADAHVPLERAATCLPSCCVQRACFGRGLSGLLSRSWMGKDGLHISHVFVVVAMCRSPCVRLWASAPAFRCRDGPVLSRVRIKRRTAGGTVVETFSEGWGKAGVRGADASKALVFGRVARAGSKRIPWISATPRART